MANGMAVSPIDLTSGQPDVQSVRSTEVGRFLDFDKNPDLVDKLIEIFGDDPQDERY